MDAHELDFIELNKQRAKNQKKKPVSPIVVVEEKQILSWILNQS
jgi:hypothetical protein